MTPKPRPGSKSTSADWTAANTPAARAARRAARATVPATDTPLDTFRVEAEETGTCHVPNTFAPNVKPLLASLDWSRVFNTSGDLPATAVELDAAATAAELLAAQCRDYARSARQTARAARGEE